MTLIVTPEMQADLRLWNRRQDASRAAYAADNHCATCGALRASNINRVPARCDQCRAPKEKR